MNWEFWVFVLPSVVAVFFAVLAFVLKMKAKEMEGMGKEVSEFLLAIIQATQDRHVTQGEILDIIKEGEDIIVEAKKLMSRE